MSLNLKKLLGRRWETPFAIFNIPNLGECRLCALTVSDTLELGKILNKEKKDCTPEEVADATLRFALRRKEDDPSPSLSTDEVAAISSLQKEEIFEKLLEGSEYLYRESISTAEPSSEDGTRKIRIERGEIIHPRMVNESAIQYYYRLIQLHEEEQTKVFKEMFKKLNFSSGLNEQIEKSFRNLDGIINPLKNISKQFDFGAAQKAAIEPIFSDPTLNLAYLENPNLKALDKLTEEIVRSNEKSLAVSAEISQRLLSMLNELKGSTDGTNKSLKIAAWSLIGTIAIGIFSLIISGIQLHRGSDSTDTAINSLKAAVVKNTELQKSILDRIDASNEKSAAKTQQKPSTRVSR